MADIAHASNGGRYGDADVPLVASLFGEPSRARILMALADGRALPASRLADEAGLSAQATSAQLTRLLTAGLITVEPSGRHRYYRLADGNVSAVLEAMAAGTPVVAANSGALPEVTGGAAVLVDPLNPSAIADGISRARDFAGGRTQDQG
jgi:DNA-binding transcriptional ArsR family regulator